MSAFLNILKFHPFILIWIIELNLLWCLTYFFSRSRNHNISISNSNAWMTMSSILHSFSILELEKVLWVAIWCKKFSTLEHTIRQWFVISTSDHIDLWINSSKLDHLKVVWEVWFKLNSFMSKTFVGCIQNRNCPRVFLENKKFLWECTAFFNNHCIDRLVKLICHCFSSLHLNFSMINFCCLLISSISLNFQGCFTSLDMFKHWLIHHIFWAARAIEFQ